MQVGGQRADTARVAKQKTTVGKVEAVRRDAAQRVDALAAEALASERLARSVEANAELVEAALGSVREALAGGVAWSALEKLIREEGAAGNPVAAAVDTLDLAKNRVTLRLLEEPGQPAAGQRPVKVALDLSLSAHANARLFYGARRKHNAKKERTLAASDLALAAAEKKAAQQMKKAGPEGVAGSGCVRVCVMCVPHPAHAGAPPTTHPPPTARSWTAFPRRPWHARRTGLSASTGSSPPKTTSCCPAGTRSRTSCWSRDT